MALVNPCQVSWDEFCRLFPFEQGEHIAVIGQTKSGKSTILRCLLNEQKWNVVLCSKKKDATYDKFLAQGYERIPKWPPPPQPKGQDWQHVLLWPKIEKMEDLDACGPIFDRCLNDIFIDEGWTVALDDLYYLCKELKLQKPITKLNYQVRSLGVSLVSCMQRPAWVPRSTWDQSSYAFISRLSDIDDVRSIVGLSRVSSKELIGWLNKLRRWDWLYLPVTEPDIPPCIIPREEIRRVQ